MKNEMICDALSQISDRHIAEAATYKTRRYTPFLQAAAACLAAILVIGLVIAGLSGRTQPSISMEGPPVTQPPTDDLVPPELRVDGFVPETVCAQFLLSSPSYPRLVAFPTDISDYDQWAQLHSAWSTARRELHNAPFGYIDNVNGFWKESTSIYLSGNSEENVVYSPISLYMALSMLAQTADGETRQEILNLLGSESMEALAEQARLVFENHYENDGVHTSILANSLWLDSDFTFRQDAVALLADNFYASVYQGALETPEMNIALKDWLNAQTGGLLEDSIYNLDAMDSRTAMMIASAINYRCKWATSFNPTLNTQDVFYSPAGQKTVTYMNGTAQYSPYFWGDDFTATYLSLDDGNRMWLILPDEGYTPQDILESGNAMEMILNHPVYGEFVPGQDAYPNQKSVTVNLTVPKFDVSGDLDLLTGLSRMGITQAMNPQKANFDGITPWNQQLYLGSANQGVRVSIDEEGLTGVAYTLLGVYGTGSPPEEEVDLVLDRPFLFVVESTDGVPMFTGIVNQP